jgi:hypothetical protein
VISPSGYVQDYCHVVGAVGVAFDVAGTLYVGSKNGANCYVATCVNDTVLNQMNVTTQWSTCGTMTPVALLTNTGSNNGQAYQD